MSKKSIKEFHKKFHIVYSGSALPPEFFRSRVDRRRASYKALLLESSMLKLGGVFAPSNRAMLLERRRGKPSSESYIDN